MKNAAKFGVLLALLLGASFVSAQGTATLTGVVTDSDSNVWAGATATFNLNNPYGGNPVNACASSAPVPPQVVVTLNSGGTFSGTIPQNSCVSPGGTTWTLTLASLTSAKAVTLPQQNITTSSLNEGAFATTNIASTPPRFTGVLIGHGYSNVEFQNPQIGAQFINTLLNTCQQWIGGAWVTCGSGVTPSSLLFTNADSNSSFLNLVMVPSPTTGNQNAFMTTGLIYKPAFGELVVPGSIQVSNGVGNPNALENNGCDVVNVGVGDVAISTAFNYCLTGIAQSALNVGFWQGVSQTNAPAPGEVCVGASSTTCTWQTPAAGGNYFNLAAAVTWSVGSGAGSVTNGQFVITTAASSITISAIPQTYLHLDLICVGSVTTASYQLVGVTFDGDSGTNHYAYPAYYFNPSTGANNAGANGDTALRGAFLSGVNDEGTATTGSKFEYELNDYAATTAGLLAMGDWVADGWQTGTLTHAQGGWSYRVLATAITSITLTPASGNFSVGDTVTLYGRN